MDIFTTTVCFVVFLAIVLLGGEIGLLSKFFRYPIKKHLTITGIYSLVIIVLIAIFSSFYVEIANLTSNFFFYLGIAIVSLIFAVLVLLYWNRYKVYDEKLKVFLFLGFVPISYSLMILGPSLLAPSFSFFLSGINFTLNMVESGLIVGAVLAIVMIFVYYTADFVEDYLIMEYSVIFGGIMAVLSLVFLVLAFIVPNLGGISDIPVTELTLISIYKIVLLLIGALILIGLGALLKKNHNRLE